jgi:hypothetical protein
VASAKSSGEATVSWWIIREMSLDPPPPSKIPEAVVQQWAPLVDIRVEKTFTFEEIGRLALYLDATNVFVRELPICF